MYETLICPIKKLYDIASDGDMDKVAAILLSSYDVKKEYLSVFYKVLILNFADTTDAARSDAFNKDRAEQIARFVKELPSDTDTLFVCCDRGESRSAAAAAAIMRYNKNDENTVWNDPAYHPNPLVYRLTCHALGTKVGRIELFVKIKNNKNALAKHIRNLKRGKRSI